MASGTIRARWSFFVLMVLGFGLCMDQSSALMTTIQHQECVHEEVEFDGDLVTGSFVVIDHGLSWSDEPGVELVVRKTDLTPDIVHFHSHRASEREKCVSPSRLFAGNMLRNCFDYALIQEKALFLEELRVEKVPVFFA